MGEEKFVKTTADTETRGVKPSREAMIMSTIGSSKYQKPENGGSKDCVYNAGETRIPADNGICHAPPHIDGISTPQTDMMLTHRRIPYAFDLFNKNTGIA